jgi:hypothetical protein
LHTFSADSDLFWEMFELLYALVEMLYKESLLLFAISITLSFALSACGGHEPAQSAAGGHGSKPIIRLLTLGQE